VSAGLWVSVPVFYCSLFVIHLFDIPLFLVRPFDIRPFFAFSFAYFKLHGKILSTNNLPDMKEENDIRIIDFSEYPEPTGKNIMLMPDEEYDIYEAHCEYIQLGTSLSSGNRIKSGFYCQNETEDGELCEGDVEVYRIDIPKQVRWECLSCGDKGALINYEGTHVDNSHLMDEEKRAFLTKMLSDFSGEDMFEDDFAFFDEEDEDPLAEFEYYVNPYDPEGEKFGGLTTDQIEKMLTCDWTDPASPVYVTDKLSIDEVESSLYFYNCREFLRLLNEEGPFELTRSGLLRRNTINSLIKVMKWPEGYISNLRSMDKPIDEEDIWILHGVRILLEVSDLVLHDDNKIHFVKDQLHLLENESAGELYQLLFSTYFKELDLGYFGSFFELPHLHHSVPFIFYKLIELAENWTPVDELLEEFLLFSVKIELETTAPMEMENEKAHLIFTDILEPLEKFGLLESRTTRPPSDDLADLFDYPDLVRIKPLFKKLIVFRV